MKHEDSLLREYSFALIIGGALGNLIDRIPDGQVTDMLHFHTSNFSFLYLILPMLLYQSEQY